MKRSLRAIEKTKTTSTNLASKDNEQEEKSTAVALSYDRSDTEGAPVVIASGQGEIADKIMEMAKEHDIPIHKDPDLVALLAASEVGQEIPVEAFVAVAEILRFIYEKNGTKFDKGV
ncbi:MAG: EscU/YscU/HrcU family type III secretion system export apparatus switch protein [Alphaproteobacteria bacterium]|nr:EscU/YscU/HrcU family type III secretion system export apparatus switch protein [Alphaproteobacteria bacterium]